MLYLLLEQGLNGLQYGLMLFLLAAGLTLVFGIMDVINLAHGSLYMIGAFLAAAFYQHLENYLAALLLAILATALIGALLEQTLYRRLPIVRVSVKHSRSTVYGLIPSISRSAVFQL